jgi:hypothetical protein
MNSPLGKLQRSVYIRTQELAVTLSDKSLQENNPLLAVLLSSITRYFDKYSDRFDAVNPWMDTVRAHLQSIPSVATMSTAEILLVTSGLDHSEGLALGLYVSALDDLLAP